jgi:hypothetical protein
MSDKIVIQTGNIISSKGSKDKFNASQLEGIFTFPESPSYDSVDHKPGTSNRRSRKAKANKDWETVEKNVKTEGVSTKEAMQKVLAQGKKSTEDWMTALEGAFDKDRLTRGAIKPSRSGLETNEGGRSLLPGPYKNSIFNPDAIANAKNDKMTDAVINDARLKRKERESRSKRSRDWEKPSIAQSSKDFKPGQMGYTPNRSAYQQSEFPEVTSPEIEAVRRQSAENEKKAEKAVKIAYELKDIYLDKMEREAKDNRPWEQKKLDEILDIQRKSYSVEKGPVQVARDFVPIDQKIYKNIRAGLNEIFTMPENPEEVKKELNIKRKSKISDNRKKREDDRSWEKISKPKTTKFLKED